MTVEPRLAATPEEQPTPLLGPDTQVGIKIN